MSFGFGLKLYILMKPIKNEDCLLKIEQLG